MTAMIGLDFIGDDEPGAVFERSAERQAAAFRGPRARELAVHHPAFDMAGSQLLDFRVGDMLLHAWDLARATGADEALDPGLGAFVWASLEPLADPLRASGAFGSGPCGAVNPQSPRQVRLLDLSGRRP